MSSSQSLRPQYPVTGQRATAKASEGGRGIIGQHSRRSHLRVLEKRLESPHTIIPDDFRNLVADLRAVVSLYLQDQENFVIDEAYLHLEFPSVADLSRPIELGIASYRQFGACYNKHRHPKPSPSDYALHWASQGVPSLLCGRPPDRHGPPLSTLHDVFREFIVRVGSPLPLGCPRAIQAQRAAVSLCRWMGESFVDQTSRSTKFDDCVRGLFPEWRNQRQLKPPDEVCTGYVDRTLESVDGRIFVFREDRRDIGQGGEVYMQAARDYDLYHQIDDAADGSPAFLVCVLGPILIVSGAHWDGANAIVEPLTRPCYMLPDATNRRKEELAQVLYALRRGVDSLDISSPPQNQLRPSTPRVYRDCLSTVGQVPLGSLSDFETSPFSDRLIFSASLMRPNVAPERVFVKLVTRPYGEKVHDYLASHGCAPKLYGCKALEGAPMAYVMEHLDTDWISLFDLAVGQNRAVAQAPDVLMAIRNAVERVLSILETATLVHGDFRSNNIMVRLDHGGRPMLSDSGSVQLKVVDFDWSGEAGAVRYPATRNTDIAWPGRSGEAIEAGDDRRLFDWWWPRFSPPL